MEEIIDDDPMKEVYLKLCQIGILDKDKKQEDLTKEMNQMIENDKELSDHLENVMLEIWLVRYEINSAISDMR
jgi:predicted  nucleic acid-binding Zn-ribbon protein